MTNKENNIRYLKEQYRLDIAKLDYEYNKVLNYSIRLLFFIFIDIILLIFGSILNQHVLVIVCSSVLGIMSLIVIILLTIEKKNYLLKKKTIINNYEENISMIKSRKEEEENGNQTINR